MGLTQSAIKTLHQPPLGIINNIGKIFVSQTLGDSHCMAYLIDSVNSVCALIFDRPAICILGKSFIMTFKDEIFMRPHAMASPAF